MGASSLRTGLRSAQRFWMRFPRLRATHSWPWSGALLIADLVAPTSEPQRRHFARAWDEDVREASCQACGDLRGYDAFVRARWNIFEFPDEEVDRLSSVREHLHWLDEAGFVRADLIWLRAGHAVFAAFRP